MNFSPLPAPNYTQAPNIVYDEIAKTLKEGELRILLVIIRQTFGWHKRWDRISMKQLEVKTGMRRNAVNNSLKSLVEKGVLEKRKEGPKGQEKCWYSLRIEFVQEEPEYPDDERDFIEDSNSSYQSPKETPPSLLKRPTKETITKEREEASLRSAKKDSPAAQTRELSFFKFKRVKMKMEAYDKLLKDFGKPMIEEMLERLEEYADINPKRFKQYANHATVIRKWIREDAQKGPKKAENRIKGVQEWLRSGDAKEAFKRALDEGRVITGNGYVEFVGLTEGHVKLDNPKAKGLIEHYLRKVLGN